MIQEISWRSRARLAVLAASLVLAGGATCRADLLMAHVFEGGVSRWDAQTGELTPFISPLDAAGLGLIGPSGLARDGAGNVYVTSNFTGEVLHFDG